MLALAGGVGCSHSTPYVNDNCRYKWSRGHLIRQAFLTCRIQSSRLQVDAFQEGSRVTVTTWKSGVIQDPVHGYIPFTPLERAIINHPITQRLRYVSQNGLAHLVFPEVRTSRFAHSLGCMHLASEFLVAFLRNTPHRSELESALNMWIQQKRPMRPLTPIAGILKDAALLASFEVSSELVAAITITDQSLRLAALFHDLGHLPCSHDFEYGLERYWGDLDSDARAVSPIRGLFEASGPRPLKIHERLGHDLAKLLLQQLTQRLDPQQSLAAELAFECAFEILESEPGDPKAGPSKSVSHWLHTLIDGDLDVDRCDFLLRDGRACSFEFAAYDLRRLIDCLTVVHDRARGFDTAIKPGGRAALESFLIGRYRLYQIGIRHHKVAQIGAAVRRCIAQILQNPPDDTVEQFMNDVGSVLELARGAAQDVAQRDALLNRFCTWDDVWWFKVMREQWRSRPGDRWLGLVCVRDPGPRSMWKRIEEFPFKNEIKEWNGALPPWDDAATQVQWKTLEQDLEHRGVLVLRHRFSPWTTDPNNPTESWLCVLQSDSPTDLVPATQFSPLIKGLAEIWAADIQVQAFKESDNIPVTSDEIADILDFRGRGGTP